jgi:hypothetical protein
VGQVWKILTDNWLYIHTTSLRHGARPNTHPTLVLTHEAWRVHGVGLEQTLILTQHWFVHSKLTK